MTTLSDPTLATARDRGAVSAPNVLDRERSALEHLLPEVLGRLGWQMSRSVLGSALPPRRSVNRLDELSMLLTGLSIPNEVGHRPPHSWKDGGDGAIVALSGKDALAITRINGQEAELSSARGAEMQVRKGLHHAGRVLFIPRSSEADRDRITRDTLLRRLRQGLRTGLALSFFIHVFALLVPIFTMTVFDRVLSGGAGGSLVPILIGAGIAVACVALLRLMRARYLAAQYARLSALSGAAAEARLLGASLRTVLAESRESVEARIASAKRSVQVFSSSNTAAVFDAPFVLLSLLMIGLLGGILVLVPALYLLLMFGVAVLVSRSRADTDPILARAGQERAAMLHELGVKAPQIMESRLGGAWLGRLAEQAAYAARASYVRGLRSAAILSLASVLGTGAALATLVVGVWLTIGGAITSGALVATMLLTWRITGPSQALFVALPRLRAIRLAIRALQAPTPGEAEGLAVTARRPVPTTAPQVDLRGVWVRYDAETEPALSGVSFSAARGSVNIIIGANGAGKTTLLRVLAGALSPQSGQVFLNDVTLRQYDPAEIALSALILPALPERGAGTGAPWVLSHDSAWSPHASLDAVLSGALPQDDAAPRAGETSPRSDDPILVLLDDPTGCAETAEREAFLAFINSMRGRATVFFSTHDLSLVPVADNAIYLEDGQLRHFGPVQTEADHEQGGD